MKSGWERMVDHFESTARCIHKNAVKVNYEPGCLSIDPIGTCKCCLHDGDGLPLTQVLAEWQRQFSR